MGAVYSHPRRHKSISYRSKMQMMLLVTLLPIILSPSHALSTGIVEGRCPDYTVGSCDPSRDELIDEYDIPGDIEGAVSLCQEVCQIQEGCNFFDFNAQLGKCYLFRYRYLDNCCSSFVREDCAYTGTEVFNKDSVTDAHACQQLLNTLAIVTKGEYWVYDSTAHLCTFYNSMGAECTTLSGPKLPDLDQCSGPQTTTTARTTIGTTTASRKLRVP